MTTKIRKLDGLPIEEPELDAEGLARQRKFADAVLTEYEKTGTLTSREVRESVLEYEAEIGKYVIK